MFKIIRKQTRPNTSVEFWQGANDPSMTDEFRNYFYEKYVLTGKFISSSPVFSENKLELTNTLIWSSQADFQECKNDPVCQEGLYAKASLKESAGVISVDVSAETF